MRAKASADHQGETGQAASKEGAACGCGMGGHSRKAKGKPCHRDKEKVQ